MSRGIGGVQADAAVVQNCGYGRESGHNLGPDSQWAHATPLGLPLAFLISSFVPLRRAPRGRRGCRKTSARRHSALGSTGAASLSTGHALQLQQGLTKPRERGVAMDWYLLNSRGLNAQQPTGVHYTSRRQGCLNPRSIYTAKGHYYEGRSGVQQLRVGCC
jgi:hypothetical protein